MNVDNELTSIGTALNVANSALYLIFAAQLGLQAGWSAVATEAGRVLSILSVVFVLCAFVAYIGPVLGLSNRFHDFAMVPLVLSMFYLVVRNQAGPVAAMLRRHDDS